MLVFPWHQQHVCRLFFPRADCRIELGILCSFQNAVPDFRTFLPIFSVQNKFSVYDKAASKPLPETVLGSCEKGMLEYCLQEGIHFFPYGALGGLTARRGGRKMNAKVAEKAREKNVSPVSAAPRHGFSDFRSLWTFGKVPSAANTVPPTLHTHTYRQHTHTYKHSSFFRRFFGRSIICCSRSTERGGSVYRTSQASARCGTWKTRSGLRPTRSSYTRPSSTKSQPQ